MPVPARNPARLVVASLALIGVLGFGSWYVFRPEPAPTPPAPPTATAPNRELTWWLTVRRMQGSALERQPFQSAGRDWYPPGTKFKFNLTSPQAGYLYLLNEGPADGGKISLNLLYPNPAGKNLDAAVAANQPIQTGNYDFDPNPGEEKFWIVWAANPVAEIEAIKAKTVEAEIQDANQSAAILQLLQQHAANSVATPNEEKEQTKVVGADSVAQVVRLKHR
jgi:hypothetical protein